MVNACLHAGAIDDLRRAADGYLSIANSELPAHKHLTADERCVHVCDCVCGGVVVISTCCWPGVGAGVVAFTCSDSEHRTNPRRATVAKEAKDTLDWLNEKVALQAQVRPCPVGGL